jgi:hypothetical protein
VVGPSSTVPYRPLLGGVALRCYRASITSRSQQTEGENLVSTEARKKKVLESLYTFVVNGLKASTFGSQS